MLLLTTSLLFCLLRSTIILAADDHDVVVDSSMCGSEYHFEEDDKPVYVEYKGDDIEEECYIKFVKKEKTHYNVEICAEVKRFEVVNPDTKLEYHEFSYFSGSADKVYDRSHSPDDEWCADDLWTTMYVVFNTRSQPNGQDNIRVKVYQNIYPDMTSWLWKGIIIGAAGVGVMILGCLFYLAKYLFQRARQRQREAYYDTHFPRRQPEETGNNIKKDSNGTPEQFQLVSQGGQEPNSTGTQQLA